MNVKIIYFVHGTTKDNEAGKSTGWADGELSDLGIQQAKDLGRQASEKGFSVIFCSDLKRAVDSVALGFQDDYPIIQDRRLRECDYGDLTQADEDLVDYSGHIDIPFTKGESMKDVEKRVRDFLIYLKKDYKGKFVAVLAHKAPQLALEVVINGQTWEEAIKNDWRNRKAWQPGWIYELKD
jgi:broad specificity phosphatase PhoE